MKSVRFSTEEVQAVLEGRKTVMRRAIKPQPNIHFDTCTKPGYFNIGENQWVCEECGGESDYNGRSKMKAPYQVGDVLWVQETWQECCRNQDHSPTIHSKYCYCASLDSVIYGCIEECGTICKWRPSNHIPEEAIRIFLNVTDVRVERLHDITEEQAEKEGCVKIPYKPAAGKFGGDDMEEDEISARELYSELWDSTNKKKAIDEFGWNADPWVWVIEFKIVFIGEAKQ